MKNAIINFLIFVFFFFGFSGFSAKAEETSISSLEMKISKLEEELCDLRKQVNQLKKAAAEVETETEAETETKALEDRVKAVEDKISDLVGWEYPPKDEVRKLLEEVAVLRKEEPEQWLGLGSRITILEHQGRILLNRPEPPQPTGVWAELEKPQPPPTAPPPPAPLAVARLKPPAPPPPPRAAPRTTPAPARGYVQYCWILQTQIQQVWTLGYTYTTCGYSQSWFITNACTQTWVLRPVWVQA